MASTLYKELEKCVQSLEGDVQNSLKHLNEAKSLSESAVDVENSRDYHFKEILSHLKQIKRHIKNIEDHDKSLQLLENRISNGSKIDRNYIKKQVESFQNIGVVNRREHKPVRPRETSTLKMLECWEKMIEEHGIEQIEPSIRRRANSLRKEKKVISSTTDTFLESPARKCMSLESLLEDRAAPEAVNEIIKTEKEEPIDTKPRIVEVIFKKNAKVHV